MLEDTNSLDGAQFVVPGNKINIAESWCATKSMTTVTIMDSKPEIRFNDDEKNSQAILRTD